MKHKVKYLAICSISAALCLAYFRPALLSRFTSFESDKSKSFHESIYAQTYRDADKSVEGSARLLAKIRWDLWCIAMSGKISEPKTKDGLIFYVFDASDRTDTRYIYVFSAEGALIEIAFEPLA